MSELLDKRISRRTVAKGAAWAAPAILVASAAPAFAVSPGTVTFTALGLGCKLPGASCQNKVGVTKGYVIRVQVCSTAQYPVEITVRDASVSLNNEPSTKWQISAVTGTGYTATTVTDPDTGEQDDVMLKLLAAPAGGSVCAIVDFGIEGEPSSQNVSVSGSAPYSWTIPTLAGSGTFTGTLNLSAASTPPCDNCAPPTTTATSGVATTAGTTSASTSSAATSTSASQTAAASSSAAAPTE